MLEYLKMKFGGGYLAVKDGRKVAILHASRDYTRGTRSRVNGKFYVTTYKHRLMLSARGTLAEVKAKLATFEFASPELEYGLACQAVEEERRAYKSRELALKLADAARAVVSGSNYAHEQLRALTEEIERFAKDRSDHEYRDDLPVNYPYYPEPDE